RRGAGVRLLPGVGPAAPPARDVHRRRGRGVAAAAGRLLPRDVREQAGLAAVLAVPGARTVRPPVDDTPCRHPQTVPYLRSSPAGRRTPVDDTPCRHPQTVPYLRSSRPAAITRVTCHSESRKTKS